MQELRGKADSSCYIRQMKAEFVQKKWQTPFLNCGLDKSMLKWQTIF